MAHLPFSCLKGNLYKASVEQFTYGEGQAGVRFKLITQRKWKDKSTGEEKETKPFYHQCTAYGKDAETIWAAREGGFIITIDPDFKLESWGDDENKKWGTKVIARFIKAWKYNADEKQWEEQELVGANATSQASGEGQDLPF